MESKSKKVPSADDSVTHSAPTDLPERWSAQRKTEVVLHLLRGESLDRVSRENQVPAHELEGWRRAFLDAGMRGFKRHVESEDRELIRTRAKIGELLMRLEVAEDLIDKRGLVDEWKKRTP
jgi:transposase-like protein